MGWGTLLKLAQATLPVVSKTASFATKHPKTFAGFVLAPVIGWKYAVNDQSLLEQATEVTLGENVSSQLKDKGVGGAVNTLVFGKDGASKSLGENIIDGVIGQGTYQKAGETAGNVVDAAGNVIQNVGQSVSDIYHGAQGMVAGLVQGQNGQQQYIPPTDMTAYQQQAMMQYQCPQQNQGGGLFSALNPFNGIGDVMNSILGGGSGMSLAALIPAAFLMFGNFGWMGKIASLFLGSLAMKNMRQQQLLMPQQVPQMQQPLQVDPALVQHQIQQNYQMAQTGGADNDYIVKRNR